MLEILFSKIPDEYNTNVFSELNFLNEKKREELSKNEMTKNHAVRIYAAAAAAKLAATYMGRQADSLVFSYDKAGKPFFEGVSDFHFNISHSGEYFTVAVSDKPVGIDIEIPRKYPERMIERFFAKDEQAFYQNNLHGLINNIFKREDGFQSSKNFNSEFFEITHEIPDSEKENSYSKQDKFFYIWTRKEAYLKFTGEGLFGGLSGFSTVLPPQKNLLRTFEFKIYTENISNETISDENTFNETISCENMTKKNNFQHKKAANIKEKIILSICSPKAEEFLFSNMKYI